MIRHIVMFWLKDKSEENIQTTVSLLKGMEGKIEGLLALEAGRDIVSDERSCDICLSCLFTDRQALETYRTHPVHLPVQAHMHKVREKSASADFEV